MNQIETKIAYTGIKCLLARWRSKSPALFQKIQWFGKVAGTLWATAIALDQSGFFAFMTPAAHSQFVVITTAISALLVGGGIIAKLPSTDPNLVSQEVKDAILNQAVADGTHVEVKKN